MILFHYHMQDILLDFTSIAQWLKDNWYWVLAGFGALSEYTINHTQSQIRLLLPKYRQIQNCLYYADRGIQWPD